MPPTINTSTEIRAASNGAVITATHAPEFWDQRPELGIIRDYARQRMASPWGVFGVALARVLYTVPPWVTLPAIIGAPASLNPYVGIVGMSGEGKGIAEDVAAEAVILGGTADPYTVPLGSGEGMVSQYAHAGKGEGGELELKVDRNAVLFTADEIDSLNAQTTRTGTTLSAQLRSAWMGKGLGYAYRDMTKRIILPAHSYRLCLVTGIQPGRAGELLAQSEGGLPQRFLWLPAGDPDARIPTSDDTPDPVRLADQNWRGGMQRLVVPREAVDEIRGRRLAGMLGHAATVAEDGHTLLCRLKVAAGLALLADRRVILADDWTLAATVMAVSAATRMAMVAHLAGAAEGGAMARGRLAGISADVAETVQTERKLPRIGVALLGKLDGRWTARNDLRHRLASRDRPLFDDAIEALCRSGQIESADNDGAGVSYRRKASR